MMGRPRKETTEEARQRRREKAAAWMRAKRARLRAERWEALDDEGRRAWLAARSASRREAARRGWVGRRERAGLPAGPAEAATVARLYRRDVETLRRYHQDAKQGLRTVLEGLALALESGVLEWAGDGWRLVEGP